MNIDMNERYGPSDGGGQLWRMRAGRPVDGNSASSAMATCLPIGLNFPAETLLQLGVRDLDHGRTAVGATVGQFAIEEIADQFF